MLFACLDDAPEDLPIGELHEPLLAQWQTELEIGSSALAALEAWCEPKRTPGTPLPARTQIEASVRSTT